MGNGQWAMGNNKIISKVIIQLDNIKILTIHIS